MYSFGVTLWEIFSGHTPYDTESKPESELKLILRDLLRDPQDPLRPDLTLVDARVQPLLQVISHAVSLMNNTSLLPQQCWAMDPKDRLSAAVVSAELLKLPRISRNPSLATSPQVAATAPSASAVITNAPTPVSAPVTPPLPLSPPATQPKTSTASTPLAPASKPPPPPSAAAAGLNGPPHASPPVSVISPSEALAAFQSVLTDASAAAVRYRDDIEFAMQLCHDFAAEEGKNYEISGPLHEAQTALKKILSSSQFAKDHKAQIVSGLSHLFLSQASDHSFRDKLVRSDALQVYVRACVCACVCACDAYVHVYRFIKWKRKRTKHCKLETFLKRKIFTLNCSSSRMSQPCA